MTACPHADLMKLYAEAIARQHFNAQIAPTKQE